MRIRDIIEQQADQQVKYTQEIPVDDQLFAKIKTECSDIIAELKKTETFLYRGSKTNVQARMGIPNPNRRAKDSKQDISDIFNQVLIASGFAATRQNSIFATTRHADAEDYGTIYYVFPKNGFDFMYTTERDLILHNDAWFRIAKDRAVEDWADKIVKWVRANVKKPSGQRDPNNWLDPHEQYGELMSRITRLQEALRYKDKRRIPRLASELDDMLTDEDVPDALKPKITLANTEPSRLLDMFKPTDTNLAYALTKGLEICFANAGYYQINSEDKNLSNRVKAEIFGLA
jgi:hypothetical protein